MYFVQIKTANNRTNMKWWQKDAEIMVPLKYLGNF